jgi:hypothetical protein
MDKEPKVEEIIASLVEKKKKLQALYDSVENKGVKEYILTLIDAIEAAAKWK